MLISAARSTIAHRAIEVPGGSNDGIDLGEVLLDTLVRPGGRQPRSQAGHQLVQPRSSVPPFLLQGLCLSPQTQLHVQVRDIIPSCWHMPPRSLGLQQMWLEQQRVSLHIAGYHPKHQQSIVYHTLLVKNFPLIICLRMTPAAVVGISQLN